MTRLSEALHGAADRAPVDEVNVSVPRAARRVRLNRATRGSANAVAGLAAVALVVAGVINADTMSSADSVAAEAPELPLDHDEAFTGAAENGSEDAGLSRLADWGTCGAFPLDDWGWGTDEFSIRPEWSADEVDGGSTVEVPVTVTANDDYDVTTTGPVAVVLWDGMVVARATTEGASEALSLVGGDTAEYLASIELVSCFDGEALPPNTYELLVSQAFLNSVVATPLPEPEPLPLPTVGPTASPRPDPVGPSIEPGPRSTPMVSTLQDAEENMSGADGAVTTAIGPAPEGCMFGPADELICEGEVFPDAPPVELFTFRAVAEPIPFTIAGETVPDPFAEYFPEPWTPPTLPEGALTPEIARELFDEYATDAPWDMAPGSSRWLLRSHDIDEERTYYGCPWGGTAGTTFPAPSADLRLIDVEADVPASISVSYGWVVDGNPIVSMTATNVSEYELPGAAYGPPRSLFLVDASGRVVAETWPTDIDPYSRNVIAREEEASANEIASTLVVDEYWDLLGVGESVSGTYLWRDVSACWDGDGPSELVAGTYTLLAMQTFSMSEYAYGWGPEEVEVAEAEATVGAGADAAADAVEIEALLPDIDAEYGWAELQVWNALGSITVTT